MLFFALFLPFSFKGFGVEWHVTGPPNCLHVIVFHIDRFLKDKVYQ